MFASINSAALPLNSKGKLKIYSVLSSNGDGFRLTNGIKHEGGGLAIIGGNAFNMKPGTDLNKAIKAVLRVLRPMPEIVVIGGGGSGSGSVERSDEISREFGCAVEATKNKMTAAEMFNTLIDDDRRVIAFFN